MKPTYHALNVLCWLAAVASGVLLLALSYSVGTFDVASILLSASYLALAVIAFFVLSTIRRQVALRFDGTPLLRCPPCEADRSGDGSAHHAQDGTEYRCPDCYAEWAKDKAEVPA